MSIPFSLLLMAPWPAVDIWNCMLSGTSERYEVELPFTLPSGFDCANLN